MNEEKLDSSFELLVGYMEEYAMRLKRIEALLEWMREDQKGRLNSWVQYSNTRMQMRPPGLEDEIIPPDPV